VTALREDGSGEPYVHPRTQGREELYFKLPFEYWTAAERWYRTLSLAETALLLIGLSLADGFVLPYESARRWYGISPDTAERGLRGLQRRGLLSMRRAVREAPLAPEGYVEERYYTLQPPFGPRGRRSSSSQKAVSLDL
jgi:hypothetical protein